MSTYLAVYTPIGFYIFLDPQMILVESNFDSDPNIVSKLQKKASYIFPDPLIAAKIIHSVEHKYILPDELVKFFTSFTKRFVARAVSAKWYFLSQILSQLVSDKFNFLCFYIPQMNARLVCSFLPELTGATQEELDDASRNVALAMCSKEFNILNDDIGDKEEEEEDQNQPETYIQEYIFLDSDS